MAWMGMLGDEGRLRKDLLGGGRMNLGFGFGGWKGGEGRGEQTGGFERGRNRRRRWRSLGLVGTHLGSGRRRIGIVYVPSSIFSPRCSAFASLKSLEVNHDVLRL